MSDRTRTLTLDDPQLPTDTGLSLFVAHHRDPRHVGRIAVLEPGRLQLGRDADVLGVGLLDDSRISGTHAVLTITPSTLHIRDAGSHNGTWVNARRVEECSLRRGDRVALGDLLLVVGTTPSHPPEPDHVGVSAAWTEAVHQTRLAAPHPTTLLLLGEPGVGKDRLARLAHERSSRPGEYVALNCAGLSNELLHSELFGHTRGAFTGAGAARAGLVREAAGGTLFLDEIGDAPPPLQASLLRLLQNREIRAVGSDRTEVVDVRIVAATNADLAGRVADGRVRQDLADRLREWEVRVPSLADRPEDIGLLALHAARRVRDCAPDRALVDALLAARWPGNVRQLLAVVGRIARSTVGRRLSPPVWLHEVVETESIATAPPRADRASRQSLLAQVRAHEGNLGAVARHFGVHRSTLYRWMRAHDLDPATVRDMSRDTAHPDPGDDSGV